MNEVFLREEDEERLKRDALDKVFLAFLTLQVARTSDPAAFLREIGELAKQISRAGTHSDEPDTNEYAKNFVAGVIEKYLQQIKIGSSV